MPDLVEIFQQNVKLELKRRGMKQADLARLLNISKPSMSVMLNRPDQWRPGLDTVQKVARALQIDPAAILLLPRSESQEDAQEPQEDV